MQGIEEIAVASGRLSRGEFVHPTTENRRMHTSFIGPCDLRSERRRRTLRYMEVSYYPRKLTAGYHNCDFGWSMAPNLFQRTGEIAGCGTPGMDRGRAGPAVGITAPDARSLTGWNRNSTIKGGLDAVTSGLSYGCGETTLRQCGFPAFCAACQAPLPAVGGVAQVVRATVS